MRKIGLTAVVLATLAGCSDMPVDGLSRSGWDTPTTMPPVGYTKSSWVDAKGCVFFATGSGWVPQIGANLRQVCR